MKLKSFYFGAIAMIIFSCATDNEDINEPQQTISANFTIIGADVDTVYEFSYDGASDTGVTNNLTAELGVSPNFLTLRQLDELISFYSFSNNSFSLAQKNVENGNTNNFTNFYSNEPSRSIVWGINNTTNAFLGYFPNSDTRDFAVLDIQLSNLESRDVTIAADIDAVFQPLLFGNSIFISFRDMQDNYKLIVYDTASKTVGPLLNFDKTPISIFIDSNSNLAVVRDGTNVTLERYNANTLSLIDSRPIATSRVRFNPGVVEGVVLSDNRLYYAVSFAQPALFSEIPAIYDFENQENNILSIENIVAAIETEQQTDIFITGVSFSESQRIFVVAYTILTGDNLGGVVQISVEGELLSNTTLPFEPVFIVQD